MFENPRRGRQERNFTTNAPKILDLGAPDTGERRSGRTGGGGKVQMLGHLSVVIYMIIND